MGAGQWIVVAGQWIVAIVVEVFIACHVIVCVSPRLSVRAIMSDKTTYRWPHHVVTLRPADQEGGVTLRLAPEDQIVHSRFTSNLMKSATNSSASCGFRLLSLPRFFRMVRPMYRIIHAASARPLTPTPARVATLPPPL